MKNKNKKMPSELIVWGFHEVVPHAQITNESVDSVPDEFPSFQSKRTPCSENPGLFIDWNSPNEHHGEFL